jgi:hypothetical protein
VGKEEGREGRERGCRDGSALTEEE